MGGSTLTLVAAVRRFYEEVFNEKNVAAIDDFLAPHGIDRALPPSQAVSKVPNNSSDVPDGFP